MTPQELVLQNIKRVGEIFNWSGWQIRFVQAGATLLGRDFPGLSDPDVTDEQLIQIADGLSKELLEISPIVLENRSVSDLPSLSQQKSPPGWNYPA